MSQWYPGPLNRGRLSAISTGVALTTPNAYNDFVVDLLVIEAGLRLTTLPLENALKRGKARALDAKERQKRRAFLLSLCERVPFNVIDESLYADAVARRPDLAERLASRSS